jgi:hypothetical protein
MHFTVSHLGLDVTGTDNFRSATTLNRHCLRLDLILFLSRLCSYPVVPEVIRVTGCKSAGPNNSTADCPTKGVRFLSSSIFDLCN